LGGEKNKKDIIICMENELGYSFGIKENQIDLIIRIFCIQPIN